MTLYNRQHVLDLIKPFNLLFPLEDIEYYKEKSNSGKYDITLVPHTVQDYQAWLVYLTSHGISPGTTGYADMIILALEEDDYLKQTLVWNSYQWHAVPQEHL